MNQMPSASAHPKSGPTAAVRTILVVEDEVDMAKLVERQLAREGFRVVTCGDGLAARELVAKERPDLIVLDVMLPGLNGFDFTKQVRQTSRVPIVMVTAKSEEVDRVLGLELGADDYVVKPFSPRELVARINAVLRRTDAPKAAEAVSRVGALEVDRDRYDVRVGGAKIALTAKEYRLLIALLDADGKVLGREDLLKQVWGYERAADIDTRTVDQHVVRLREKLGPEAVRVVTVRGAGYRFQA